MRVEVGFAAPITLRRPSTRSKFTNTCGAKLVLTERSTREALRRASNKVETLLLFWHCVRLRVLPSLTGRCGPPSRRDVPRRDVPQAVRHAAGARGWYPRGARMASKLWMSISMPFPLGAPPQLVLGEFSTKSRASFAHLRLKGPLWPAVSVRMLYFQQDLQRAASRHKAEPAGKPSE